MSQRKLRRQGRILPDQLENLQRAHYNGTGREIYEQTNGKVDAFVMGAGTGGTFQGRYLLAEKRARMV